MGTLYLAFAGGELQKSRVQIVGGVTPIFTYILPRSTWHERGRGEWVTFRFDFGYVSVIFRFRFVSVRIGFVPFLFRSQFRLRFGFVPVRSSPGLGPLRYGLASIKFISVRISTRFRSGFGPILFGFRFDFVSVHSVPRFRLIFGSVSIRFRFDFVSIHSVPRGKEAQPEKAGDVITAVTVYLVGFVFSFLNLTNGRYVACLPIVALGGGRIFACCFAFCFFFRLHEA